MLVNFSNEEIFNIFIQSNDEKKSFIEKMCWATKQSNYNSIDNIDINKKDERYNNEIFYILSPIIERFRKDNPEYLAIFKATSLMLNNILVFDKLKHDEVSYQQIIGETSLDNPLLKKLYRILTFKSEDYRLNKYYKTHHYHYTYKAKSELTTCNFLYIYFASSLSVIKYLYNTCEFNKKDEIGNTSFHVFSTNCHEHLKSFRNIDLLDNLLTEKPEIFFEPNRNGDTPSDFLLDYAQKNKNFEKNKVASFVNKLGAIKAHFQLDKKLSQDNNKKTKLNKI